MKLDRLLELAWEYREAFIAGAWISLTLTVLAMVIAAIAGLALTIGIMSQRRIVRYPAITILEFFRNTPILVLVVWVHFALPDLIGVKLVAYASSVLALALQSTGYLAEDYRAGIESIDKGQFEAARSLGMTFPYLMRRIILPQAFARIVPSVLNQFVLCFKSTSVVSIIAVPDIMYVANVIVNNTFLPMYIYTIAAVMYFGLVFVISASVRYLTEKIYEGQRVSASFRTAA